MRTKQLAPFRERIGARAEGRVLEIGAGSGLNLPYYTDRVSEILGIEPHPTLLGMAAAKRSPVPARWIDGSAEAIPLQSGSVDTVVTTWTLCSIPDVTAALREMRRVLRPAGLLLFVEHGLASEESVRRWQHRLTPLWKRIAGGCHLDRPIRGLIQDAGFNIASLEANYGEGPKPMVFIYEGSARPI
jgi:ubiquinone/menaquinone biosynthesis C-methylase UbiE